MKHATREPCSARSGRQLVVHAACVLFVGPACAGSAGGDGSPGERNGAGDRPDVSTETSTPDTTDPDDAEAAAVDTSRRSVPPSELPQVPASFESLTVSAFGGLQSWARASDAECDPFNHINVFEFDQTSGSLSWDWCRTGELLQGTRVLDADEVAPVLAAYSNVSAAGESCGTDEPFGWFEPRSAGVTSRFALSSMGCFDGFAAQAYVGDRGFFDLLTELQRLVD